MVVYCLGLCLCVCATLFEPTSHTRVTSSKFFCDKITFSTITKMVGNFATLQVGKYARNKHTNNQHGKRNSVHFWSPNFLCPQSLPKNMIEEYAAPSFFAFVAAAAS